MAVLFKLLTKMNLRIKDQTLYECETRNIVLKSIILFIRRKRDGYNDSIHFMFPYMAKFEVEFF